jgi:hypothetical protein
MPLPGCRVGSVWWRAILPGVRPLTTDLRDASKRPYFLWDEDVTVGELREILERGDDAARYRLMGKMLREARDIDVWQFVTPQDVSRALPHVAARLGRRLAFWEFLIGGWRADGLLTD